MSCLICGSKSIYQIFQIYDDRYGYPGKFPLINCDNCGHTSLQAKFTDDQISAMYSKYYPRSTFEVDDYRPHKELSGLNVWLDGIRSSAFRWVPKNVRVLDIGCGFGETLGYHQARGCEVYGVEADENIRRVAHRYGYKVHIGLFDANLYEPDFFDFVTMDQVFEHIQNPFQLLKDLSRILKPGGLVILSMPNIHGWGAKFFRRYWLNWHAPYHLNFYSIESIRLISEKAGLLLEKTDTLTPSTWLNLQWHHLLTYPPEGSVSTFWGQTNNYNIWQRRVNRLLNKIDCLKINHLITRFFDSLGIGDNRLFFLRKRL